MLLVPYLAGLLATGWNWLDLPLLVAWLSTYLLSHYLLLVLKIHHWDRCRAQLGLYSAVAMPTIALVVLARPNVLRIAPVYALLFAINAGCSRRGRERSLINGFASIVQSCLMVFVVASVDHAPLTGVLRPVGPAPLRLVADPFIDSSGPRFETQARRSDRNRHL